MVDVLLLVPPRTRFQRPTTADPPEDCAPPMGLLALAAQLRTCGISVAIHDMYHSPSTLDDAPGLLDEHSPRIVGVTCVSSQANVARALARALHACIPDLPIVAGGVHATVRPAELLGVQTFDYVLRGEADHTLPILAQALLRNGEPPAGLAGLCRKTGEKPETSEDVGVVEDLDALPLPARDLIDLSGYAQQGTIATSRGCNRACYFCSAATFRGRFRAQCAARILREMDAMCSEFDVHEFEFADDNLAGDLDRLWDTTRVLAERDYAWGCQLAVQDVASELEVLQDMAAAGCRSIYVGVETGDPELLRRVKGVDVASVETVVRGALAAGMMVHTGFIIGHPWETERSVDRTRAMVADLRRRGVMCTVSVLTPFPGSPVAERAQQLGVTIHVADPEEYTFSRPVISTRYLSRERIAELYSDIVIGMALEDASS